MPSQLLKREALVAAFLFCSSVPFGGRACSGSRQRSLWSIFSSIKPQMCTTKRPLERKQKKNMKENKPTNAIPSINISWFLYAWRGERSDHCCRQDDKPWKHSFGRLNICVMCLWIRPLHYVLFVCCALDEVRGKVKKVLRLSLPFFFIVSGYIYIIYINTIYVKRVIRR